MTTSVTNLTRRRRPWLAALLQLLCPGLGHLYVGRPVRALMVRLIVAALALLLVFIVLAPIEPWNLLIPLAASLSFLLLVILDAVRCAKLAGSDYQLRRYNRWYLYILVLVTLSFVQDAETELIRSNLLQAFRFPTASMEPAILIGDRLLVDKRAYRHTRPDRGDLVIFPSPQDRQTTYLKRVVALPGETISIRGGGVFINDKPLAEPYALLGEDKASDNMEPFEVPQDEYFVMGDNRDNSQDSRLWGSIARANILGRATTIYFSWDSESRRVRWTRVGMSLRGPA